MERSLQNKRERFTNLLKELETSINAVILLSEPGQRHYNFELGDTLYGRAIIPDGDRKVGLWLGAGVMLEYELTEARSFLETKRDERKEELRKSEHDLEFIRKQITTTEVNLARLYNLTVRK
jgi:prefoldin subunit 5